MIPISTALALESLETADDKFYQPVERPRSIPADAFAKRGVATARVPDRPVAKPANIWNAAFKDYLGI